MISVNENPGSPEALSYVILPTVGGGLAAVPLRCLLILTKLLGHVCRLVIEENLLRILLFLRLC